MCLGTRASAGLPRPPALREHTLSPQRANPRWSVSVCVSGTSWLLTAAADTVLYHKDQSLIQDFVHVCADSPLEHQGERSRCADVASSACQVEFSYPPLVPDEGHDSSVLPDEWRYLPFLALPDGAHNYQEGRNSPNFCFRTESKKRKTVM